MTENKIYFNRDTQGDFIFIGNNMVIDNPKGAGRLEISGLDVFFCNDEGAVSITGYNTHLSNSCFTTIKDMKRFQRYLRRFIKVYRWIFR